MMILLPLVVLLVQAPLTFQAGPPEIAKGAGLVFPMEAKEYEGFAARLRKMPGSAPIQKLPAGLGPNARFGYNLVVGTQNRGWILDGDDERGWRLYLDWAGDGDLSQARPQPFVRVEGVHRLDIHLSAEGRRWPVRFEVARVDVEGKNRLAVRIFDATIRRGVIERDGQRVPFTLVGWQGKYGEPGQSVSFDRTGDGDEESYKFSERFVNLFGRTFEFSADPAGNSLTLVEQAVTRLDRPSLRPGTVAPDFTATDIDGKTQRLSSYKGRTLLLEFWATTCGPCRAEAPRMVALYNEWSRDQLAFLGVSSDETDEVLRAFLKEFGMNWAQVREDSAGPVQKLYRVTGIPAYYLVGPDGRILEAWMGSGQTRERLLKHLAR